MDKIPKVLFLSRGSASRSQIAEGLLRAMAGNQVVAISAGTESLDVNPVVSEVMREIGVDTSTQKPSEIAPLFKQTFHYVVALSDEPREKYPLYPFTRNLLKWSVPNPEIAAGEPEARKQLFRQVRDQMKGRVEELVDRMNQAGVLPATSHAMAA